MAKVGPVGSNSASDTPLAPSSHPQSAGRPDVPNWLFEGAARTSDPHRLLKLIRTNTSGSIQDLRLSFKGQCATLFGLPAPSVTELGVLARSSDGRPVHLVDDRIYAVVRCGPMVHGVLSARVENVPAEEVGRVLASAATAIGQVAYKGRLRRLAERPSNERGPGPEPGWMMYDLHDSVGSMLNKLADDVQGAIERMGDAGSVGTHHELRTFLEEMRRELGEGISDLLVRERNAARLQLRRHGLIESVRTMVDWLASDANVNAELRAGPIPELDRNVEVALVRAANELVVNVERPSRATGVVVMLNATESRVQMTFLDDGVDLDSRFGGWRPEPRFAIRAAAHLLEPLSGRLVTMPLEPRGLSISITVPLEPKTAQNEDRR